MSSVEPRREHPEDPSRAYTWLEFLSFFLELGYSEDYAWRQWGRSLPIGPDGEPAWRGCVCCHCRFRRQQHIEALKLEPIAIKSDTLRKQHLFLLCAFQIVAGNMPFQIKRLIWSYLRNPFELWIASFDSVKKTSKSGRVQVVSFQNGHVRAARRFQKLPMLPALAGPGKQVGQRILNIVVGSTFRTNVTEEGFQILGRLAKPSRSRMFYWIATKSGLRCSPMLPSDVDDDEIVILEKAGEAIKFAEDVVAVSLKNGWAAIECFNGAKGQGKGKGGASRLVRLVELESGETIDQCWFPFSYGLDGILGDDQGLHIYANGELLIVAAAMNPYLYRIHALIPKAGPQQRARWLSQTDVSNIKGLAVNENVLAIHQNYGADRIHLLHLCTHQGLDPRPFKSISFVSDCDVIRMSLACSLLITLHKDKRSNSEFVSVWSFVGQQPVCLWRSSGKPEVAWMSSRPAVAEPKLQDLHRFSAAVLEP